MKRENNFLHRATKQKIRKCYISKTMIIQYSTKINLLKQNIFLSNASHHKNDYKNNCMVNAKLLLKILHN